MAGSAQRMRLIRQSEEVFVTDDPIVRIGAEELALLKSTALANPRQRVRLCGHPGVGDAVHEMLIVHTRGTYVRPHKHLGKSESFHVIEGEADILVYDDAGKVVKIVPMGPVGSGRSFFYRLNKSAFHTLLIGTDFFVFHETTKGPFDRAQTVFAPWAPEDGDAGAVAKFMQQAAQSISSGKEE
jgi:cupin fold WbuC family metalloprotein